MDPIYIVGALVASIYALTEALKVRTSRRNGSMITFNVEDRRMLASLASFTPEDRRLLETLFDQHQKVDLEGVPLWYVPRRILNGQEKTTDRIGELLAAQTATLAELQSMNKKIGRWTCPFDEPKEVRKVHRGGGSL